MYEPRWTSGPPADDVAHEMSMPIGEYLKRTGRAPDKPCLMSTLAAVQEAVVDWIEKNDAWIMPQIMVDGGYTIVLLPEHKGWRFSIIEGRVKFTVLVGGQPLQEAQEAKIVDKRWSLYDCIKRYCLVKYGSGDYE